MVLTNPILIDLAKTGLLEVTPDLAKKVADAIRHRGNVMELDWSELEKDFKPNRDRLGHDFIKLRYARLYSQHLREIIAYKNKSGITDEEYCSREAILNLIVENNERLLNEIDNLLLKSQ